MAITFSAGTFVIFISFIVSYLNSAIPYSKVLFEVISAFGTVGLSMNFTTLYDSPTKIVIVLTMLIGKIGILTFLQLFITEKSKNFIMLKKMCIYKMKTDQKLVLISGLFLHKYSFQYNLIKPSSHYFTLLKIVDVIAQIIVTNTKIFIIIICVPVISNPKLKLPD